jgi:UDP-N-acetyl-D-glucosamine/UDP-N-acetyl-D-galactosamine dehydrogenase
MASSIKVAEAAKVIENTQRDLNIALINELTMIFDRLGIDTEQVLLAAETKWNFLSFRPGLVGGHCIGIDPYYLTHKAELVGYKPKVILAGRNLNDSMHKFVVDKALLTLRAAELNYERPKVLICGFSFKENCPDIRNSKIVNLYHEFIQNGCDVDVTDPHVDPKDGLRHYNIALTASPEYSGYHLVLLAVAHDEYRRAGAGYFKELCCEGGLFFDMKYVFPSDKSDLRL